MTLNVKVYFLKGAPSNRLEFSSRGSLLIAMNSRFLYADSKVLMGCADAQDDPSPGLAYRAEGKFYLCTPYNNFIIVTKVQAL